jgi:hypothetical protein
MDADQAGTTAEMDMAAQLVHLVQTMVYVAKFHFQPRCE